MSDLIGSLPDASGGGAPNLWNNLAQLGAGMSVAANARTPSGFLAYGPGFAGPLGAATQNLAEWQRQVAALRGQVGLENAQAQQARANAQLTNFQIPLAQQSLAMLSRLGGTPSPFSQGPMGATSQPPAQPATQPTTDPNALPAGQRFDILQQAVKGTPIPADLAYSLFNHESGWNPGRVNQQTGAWGLGQTLPSTARNPGYGMQPLPANATPQQQAAWSVQYLWKRGQAAGIQDSDWGDPVKVASALAAYHGPQADANGVNGQQYATAVLGNKPFQVAQAGNGPLPMPGGVSAAGGGVPAAAAPGSDYTQSPAYQRAQQLYQLSATLGSFPMLRGAADVYKSQADNLMQVATAGPIAGAQAAARLRYAVNTLRGPGSVLAIGGKPVLQVPMEVRTTDPNTGQEITRFVEPIEGTQGGGNLPAPFVSKLGPGQESSIKAAAEDAFGERARGQYQSAISTLRAMSDIEHQFNTLNAGGANWYQTGEGADWRLALAKTINGTLGAAGASPLFDPTKIAAGEDLLKQTKLAGMQTLATFFGGNREAASIVHSATSAVPNIENTPMGGLLVLNSVREAAREIADQHAFMANWYNAHGGNMVGADVAFNQARPPALYTKRAISQVRPFVVPNNPSVLQRFLPGTRIMLKGSNVVKMIPGMPDVQLQQAQQ